MAVGDVTFFDQFLVDVMEGVHNLETDDIRLGLIDGVVPLVTTADPHWGGTGTTNYLTNESTPGGNYATGGPAIANPTVTLTGGAAVFDGDDILIAQNPSNPTAADYGIIYNNTPASKKAIGFVELPADSNLSGGDFTITWNTSGIAALNQAV